MILHCGDKDYVYENYDTKGNCKYFEIEVVGNDKIIKESVKVKSEENDGYVWQNLHQWIDATINKPECKTRRSVEIPLQYRLFLRETNGSCFRWCDREESTTFDIFDDPQIRYWSENDEIFMDAIYINVALESDYPIYLCCDSDPHGGFGNICRYNDHGPDRLTHIENDWHRWLAHILCTIETRTRLYAGYHSSPDANKRQKIS